MPYANLKVPAGLLTAEQKAGLVTAVTDLYADVFGERARPSTMVLVDEVADGGWGLGGQVLTRERLAGQRPEPVPAAAQKDRPSA